MAWYNNFIKKKEADKTANVSNYIQKTSSNRVRQELTALREALKEAEQYDDNYKFRNKMQLIFQDIIYDGHIMACMASRKSLTLKKEFQIQDSKGNQSEEWTLFLKSKWFYDFMELALDAQFFGYSGVNWTGISENKLTGIKAIRRDSIKPDTNEILRMPYSYEGINFEDEKIKDWSLLVKTNNNLGYSNCGYGLLFPCSAYAIAIRNNLGFNIDFVEKFIIPFVVAKTMKHEGDERDLLEEGIKNMASSNSVVLDPNDEIEFIESKNAGSGYNSFDNLENRCEKKISKIILGHADAIDSTSGKLGSNQNEAVEEALENVEIVDNNFIENVVNDQLFDKLRVLGFNIPKGFKFVFLNTHEKTEKLENDSKVNQLFANVVKTLKEAGHDVDSKFIGETTGYPTAKTLQPTNVNPKELNNLYGL
jgi:phage gp29-like protein